jgi:hypothetical protein
MVQALPTFPQLQVLVLRASILTWDAPKILQQLAQAMPALERLQKLLLELPPSPKDNQDLWKVSVNPLLKALPVRLKALSLALESDPVHYSSLVHLEHLTSLQLIHMNGVREGSDSRHHQQQQWWQHHEQQQEEQQQPSITTAAFSKLAAVSLCPLPGGTCDWAAAPSLEAAEFIGLHYAPASSTSWLPARACGSCPSVTSGHLTR